MKKLVMCSLVFGGLAMLATGCSAPVDPIGGEIQLSWSLVAGDNNDPSECPIGATTIAVTTEDSFGAQTTDLYDCAGANTVTIFDLPEDVSYVWVSVEDDAGGLYAQSLGVDVDVLDGFSTDVAFEFSVDRGAFDIAWEIWEGNVASDCATVGATDFSLDYTDSEQNFFGPDLFACGDYAGTTPVLKLDDWVVSPSIIEQGVPGAIAVGASIEESILYGNEFVDLGLVSLDTLAP